MNEEIERIESIIRSLSQAGRMIMEVYDSNDTASHIEWKADNSPLTLADKRSHDFMIAELAKIDEAIPIMSEESVQTEYEVRRTWKRYWCLDPLDGTKEFIKRNGQFTINLALIENAAPVLGFIHVPLTGNTYWAKKHQGAFVHDGIGSSVIRVNSKSSDWIAVGSSSHGCEAESVWLKQFPVTSYLKIGSALKFCYIASGLADVYYRSGPTMEWDTSAGHLLVEEAGAAFSYISEDGQHYNKPSLYNPPFCVSIPL
jgi:3'(2'), 5'-bisphosphate nucleotidase